MPNHCICRCCGLPGPPGAGSRNRMRRDRSVERVDVSTEGADIRLRTEGLTSLVADLSVIQLENRRAA
jgi:hypothetical protein